MENETERDGHQVNDNTETKQKRRNFQSENANAQGKRTLMQ